MSTRIGGITEEEELGNDVRTKQRIPLNKKNVDSNHGQMDELSSIVSQSQCSTCVSYTCKVCGENVHRDGGQASTAGGETCYSCSIYEGTRSALGSEISSCNSDCSSKVSLMDGWKKKSTRIRGSNGSSEERGSIRSRRSVQIIRTDSESSLTDTSSDEDSILRTLDSPQTGELLSGLKSK